MTYEYQQYLAHHGIKGQKWGVRRFQNDDGSLTEEGKKRYGQYIDRAEERLNWKNLKKASLETKREFNSRSTSDRFKKYIPDQLVESSREQAKKFYEKGEEFSKKFKELPPDARKKMLEDDGPNELFDDMDKSTKQYLDFLHTQARSIIYNHAKKKLTSVNNYTNDLKETAETIIASALSMRLFDDYAEEKRNKK